MWVKAIWKTEMYFESCQISMTDLFRRFFISNTFISNARLKLAKNQASAKQYAEAELLLFENYSLSSPTLSYKNNTM